MSALAAAWALLRTRLGAWAAAVAAVVATVAYAFLAGRRNASRAAIMQRQAEALKQRNTRDEIDRAVDRNPDPAGELRRDWSR